MLALEGLTEFEEATGTECIKQPCGLLHVQVQPLFLEDDVRSFLQQARGLSDDFFNASQCGVDRYSLARVPPQQIPVPCSQEQLVC